MHNLIVIKSSASESASVLASDLCVCTPYVAVVPIVPVLSVIVIVRPPCNYLPRPSPFFSLVMGSVTCVHFVSEGTGLLLVLVRIKKTRSS